MHLAPNRPRPTLGRIVLYRGKQGLQTIRAAIVTASFDSLDPRGVALGQVPDLESEHHVHLWVFTPGSAGGFAEYNVPPAPDNAEMGPGTWRWPPRV